MQEHERVLAEADARRARTERRWARIGHVLAALGTLALFSDGVLSIERRVAVGAAIALWAVAACFLVASDWRRRLGGGSVGSGGSEGLMGLVSALFR